MTTSSSEDSIAAEDKNLR